jgi:hypothetical protein
MSPRREFLLKCSTLAAAMALVPLGVFAKPSVFQMNDIPLDKLSFETLAAQLNSVFRVRLGPARVVELELAYAKLDPGNPPVRHPGPFDDDDCERFSLVFRGPRDQPLEQRIHKFEHDQIGRFELFIVPILSRDTARLHYEAVFNRPARRPHPNV